MNNCLNKTFTHCVACCHWKVCNSCLIKTVQRCSPCGVLLLKKVYSQISMFRILNITPPGELQQLKWFLTLWLCCLTWNEKKTPSNFLWAAKSGQPLPSSHFWQAIRVAIVFYSSTISDINFKFASDVNIHQEISKVQIKYTLNYKDELQCHWHFHYV